MSGGVDSSVAAYLLKQQGHDLTGANMRFWEYKSECSTEESSKKRITSCCSPEDMADAEKSARGVGIPFYALKMEGDFREKVIDPFINDYASGRTPNPCVHCNTFIKFGEFFKKADVLGFDAVATGHYASVKKLPNGRYAIAPAADARKDQSYYLYGMTQSALSKTVFPLGGLKKDAVRKIAEENHLPVAQKPESQEICFIPENNYREFLRKEGLEFQKGFIRNSAGRIIAEHDGKENFTIGQRKGLGIALGEPAYVIDILDNGDVIVGSKAELRRKTFFIRDVIYQGYSEDDFSEPVRVLVQIRYNSRPLEAEVIQRNGYLEVRVEQTAEAVTRGQAGVIYHPGERYILAGGKIEISEEKAVPAPVKKEAALSL